MKINKTKKTMKDALDLLNDCGYYLCDICDEFYDKENREETCMDCGVEL
jgi:regulator of replication initiation timing|tara:strand:+ start:2076 stop:2222 length:147 start_codon:yes stop_codon:yes gene_type:complete